MYDLDASTVAVRVNFLRMNMALVMEKRGRESEPIYLVGTTTEDGRIAAAK